MSHFHLAFGAVQARGHAQQGSNITESPRRRGSGSIQEQRFSLAATNKETRALLSGLISGRQVLGIRAAGAE
jgi:hypothetical protein